MTELFHKVAGAEDAHVAWPPRRIWLTVVAVMLIFTLLQTYQAARLPRIGSSDVQNVGLVIMRDLDPDLFARDYAYGDPNFMRFYTPAYMALLRGLTAWVGNYEVALLLLLPPIMMIFLLGTYALLRSLKVRWWVALLVSLMSTYVSFTATGDRTGFHQLNAAMANSLHLAIQPWLLVLALRWLHDSPDPVPAWRYGLIGLIVGLSSNVHAGPGFHLTQALGLTLLMCALGGRVGIAKLILFAMGAGLGALPTLLFYGSNTGWLGNVVHADFSTFASIIARRANNDFPYPYARVLGRTIGPNIQIVLVVAYALVSILSLSGMLIWRQRKPRLFSSLVLIFGLAQILMAAVMAWDALLGLLAGLWWILVADRSIHSSDGLIIKGTAAVNLIVWVIAPLVVLAWHSGQIEGLTPLVIEEPRTSMLIFWPLRMIIGRFLDWANERLDRPIAGVVLTVGFVVAFSPPQSLRWLALILALLLFLPEMLRRAAIPPALANGMLLIGVTSTGAYIVMRLLGRTEFSLTVLAVGMVVGAALVLGRLVGAIPARLAIGFVSLGMCLAAIWLLPAAKTDEPRTLGHALIAAPTEWRQHWLPDRSAEADPEMLALIDVADWFRSNTPKGSLVYTNRFDFRYRAQRPITHSWKDIGSVGYSRSQVVPFYERYQLFERGFADEAIFRELVDRYGIDYVLLGPSGSLPVDELPVCYANEVYRVLGVHGCP